MKARGDVALALGRPVGRRLLALVRRLARFARKVGKIGAFATGAALTLVVLDAIFLGDVRREE
jgi:hypothetical protein